MSDNIAALHFELTRATYRHGGYRTFCVADPKPRQIHVAPVRDRLVHHAVHRILAPHFDRTFIADSFSCRIGKGTHRALNRFRRFASQVSNNNTRTCWVLQCDIKKFFANINHLILLDMLWPHLDERTHWLISIVVQSFHSTRPGIGLPLGNLTSQLLVNVYMNEFDQFVKHMLKVKHYLRYADDFVVLSEDRAWLESIINTMEQFLNGTLKLTLHPHKVLLRTLASGVDFLGWVHFPDHRVLRTTTKRWMLTRIRSHATPAALASYLGLLKQGNAHRLREEILRESWYDGTARLSEMGGAR